VALAQQFEKAVPESRGVLQGVATHYLAELEKIIFEDPTAGKSLNLRTLALRLGISFAAGSPEESRAVSCFERLNDRYFANPHLQLAALGEGRGFVQRSPHGSLFRDKVGDQVERYEIIATGNSRRWDPSFNLGGGL
jgi:hypothetical protein